MNNYNFKEFKEAGGRFKPVISLGARSGFGISSGFTTAYAEDIAGAKGVKLFYDADSKAVGFKFMKEEVPGMIGLKLRDKGGYVSAQSFIGRFQIDQERLSGRYEPKKIVDDKFGTIFVIELKDKSEGTTQDSPV